MKSNTDSLSTMRLYGSAIALVSGGYSVYLATVGMRMSTAAWFMLVLGAVVAVHGVVLVTPFAARVGTASGPLMGGYALLMLLNQAWMASMGGTGMRNGMTGMNSMGGGTGLDAGMVAIALLMLVSGVIMTARRDMMKADATMTVK